MWKSAQCTFCGTGFTVLLHKATSKNLFSQKSDMYMHAICCVKPSRSASASHLSVWSALLLCRGCHRQSALFESFPCNRRTYLIFAWPNRFLEIAKKRCTRRFHNNGIPEKSRTISGAAFAISRWNCYLNSCPDSCCRSSCRKLRCLNSCSENLSGSCRWNCFYSCS